MSPIRSRLVNSITRDVEFLVKKDRFRSLMGVMEATGFMGNGHTETTRSLGTAIIALAGVIEMSWLKGTASVAAFERAFDRPNRGEPRGDWHRAQAAGNLASRAVAS